VCHTSLRYLHLDEGIFCRVRRLAWCNDPESYAGGSVATGRATLAGQVRLAPECSNNQAEQLAIVKALQTLRDFRHLQRLQRTAVVHTDSNITLDAIQNPRNHQRLIEQI